MLIKEQKCVPKLTDFVIQIFNEFTLLQDKAYLQAFAQLTLTVVGLPVHDIVAAISKELPEAEKLLEQWK